MRTIQASFFIYVSCNGKRAKSEFRHGPRKEKICRPNDICGDAPRCCNGIFQVSDISKGFKAEKSTLSNVQPELIEKVFLKAAATLLFIQYKTENISARLSSGKIHSYTSRLQALTNAAQNVQISRVVQEGYTQFGQKGVHVDTFKTLRTCSEDIAIIKSNKLWNNMAFLGTLYNEQGETNGFF